MRSSFHVLVFFEAKPGKAEALGRVLLNLVNPSRAEPGCQYYDAFADTENSGKFTVIEGWETSAQWQMHLRAPHVLKALEEIEAAQMLLQPFKAQQLRPLNPTA
jgi:quinol monooxygenase YgiN